MNINRLQIEAEQKWVEEIDEIPWIKFPEEWYVKVIPPFGDAAVRFRVMLPSGKEKSVYLDVRHSLGYFGSVQGAPVPYWEVYPHQGDVGRCHKEDVKTLLEMIADETEGDNDAYSA